MTTKAKKIGAYSGALLLVVLVTGLICLSARTSREHPSQVPVVTASAVHIEGGWGYKIEVNHKLFIYQRQIPCLAGDQLFPTKESALAVAHMVTEKLLKGENPSLTKREVERVLPPSP